MVDGFWFWAINSLLSQQHHKMKYFSTNRISCCFISLLSNNKQDLSKVWIRHNNFASTAWKENDTKNSNLYDTSSYKNDDFGRSTSNKIIQQVQKNNNKSSLSKNCILLSLNWAGGSDTCSNEKGNNHNNNNDNNNYSKITTDIWNWKDSVLGDGRDFFIPKPKTLLALQCNILQSIPYIQECIIVSNCARFEILIVYNNKSDSTEIPTTTTLDIVKNISSVLLIQKQHSVTDKIRILLDVPPNFVTISTYDENVDNPTIHHLNNVNELTNHWTIITNCTDIVYHLCLIAAGIANRPRRPNRYVQFRPFSSRDAHILLQLKRTLDVALVSSSSTSSSPSPSSTTGKHSSNNNSNNKILSTLLRYAIQAGKAARNPEQVPVLNELRKYGTGNSKYDTSPPPNIVQNVTNIVIKDVIEPIVIQCIESIEAMSHSDTIIAFRTKALNLAKHHYNKTNDEKTTINFINKQLHIPTTILRSGQYFNESLFLLNLENKIISQKYENT